MQVLKFGGTSVANAENIQKVISIVSEAIKKDKSVVVVSALGGVTDLLLDAASIASNGNESYNEKLGLFQQRHLDCVNTLIQSDNKTQLITQVEKVCKELNNLFDGIFMLGELTARTKDRIASYGEFLSSQIISVAFEEKNDIFSKS